MTIATTDERINAQGGLMLVGKVLSKACDLSHLLSAVPSASKKVGKAHQRNFVRRRFRDLISRHGEKIDQNRYIVIIGRYSTPHVDFYVLEEEFLKICKKLQIT